MAYSQGLELGWAQGVWGRKSPPVSREELRWESGGEPPETRYISAANAVITIAIRLQ